MTFTPTAEQAHAIELFKTGESMVIEAGAGTGKTATLQLLADEATNRSGQYIAFNKAIVVEAQAKFPSNVKASTAHSLAFQAVGKKYGKRLRTPRMKSTQIARLVDIGHGIEVGEVHMLPGYLAGLVMQGVRRFCQSGDYELAAKHFPYVMGIDPHHEGRGANNWALAEQYLPAMQTAWADLSALNGALPFTHDHYLKLYQLTDPLIAADFVLFDEAQDANPVIAAIVAAQEHAQLIHVGDSQQSIYGFTGAQNALAKVDTDHRAFLTQSFRFGQAIADEANKILARIDGAELRLTGNPEIDSVVGPIDDPRAILTRTNAVAVNEVIAQQAIGRKPHLVGGGDQVLRFARAADELQRGQRTYHPELACFSDWAEVQAYVADDVQGDDIALLVRLVDDFGTDVITEALGRMPSEANADVTVSTAHKSKGREWATVRLADDFVRKPKNPADEPIEPTVEELRLQYVAVTRARFGLDNSSLAQ
jgi:hypothetical protein